MPALKPPPAEPDIEHSLPVARRRVWAHPELRSHTLAVLTLDRLYLAPLAGDPRPEVLAAVNFGADLDDLFGPLATAVHLPTVRKMKLDLLTNSLVIDAVGRGGVTSRAVVTFATPEAADACFTKVWRRLGDGVQLRPYKPDPWALARLPIALLVAVLVGTAGLAVVLSVFDDFAAARAVGSVGVGGDAAVRLAIPKTPLEYLIGWMNWRWVCGIGGVAAAALQVWTYRRLTHPPGSLVVLRT
jgi:hypothetical protein